MIDDTPPPNNVSVIFDESAINFTSVEQSESQRRSNICKNCQNFMLIGNETRCIETGFDINLMTTATELTCPLEKW